MVAWFSATGMIGPTFMVKIWYPIALISILVSFPEDLLATYSVPVSPQRVCSPELIVSLAVSRVFIFHWPRVVGNTTNAAALSMGYLPSWATVKSVFERS